jgi:hypothetical protein
MNWVSHEQLRVTHGELRDGRITGRALRAVALGSGGDAASLLFTFHGAIGDGVAHLGVELRSANSASLVYVMWRIAPRTRLTVQVKALDAAYLRIKPLHAERIELPQPGSSHKLAARIEGDRLSAWLENHLVWVGKLPPPARVLQGLVGVRADHVHADIAFAAD